MSQSSMEDLPDSDDNLGTEAEGPADSGADDPGLPGQEDGGADGAADEEEGPADSGADEPATPGHEDGGADGAADSPQ